MKIVVVGTCLGVHSGTSKKSGKPYTMVDVYDGEELIKVFGAKGCKPGEACEIPCRLTMGQNGAAFIMALS